MAYKNPLEQSQAILDENGNKDWLSTQNPKIRNRTGQPSKYHKLEKEWFNTYGTQSGQRLPSELDPFDDYDRAVAHWNKYIKDHKDEDSSLNGALEWLQKNRDVLQNPDPKEWIATSYDEDFINSFPEETRNILFDIDDVNQLVETASKYTRGNGGEYSPRQIVRLLTGTKNLFTDPYGDRENRIRDILNAWRKYNP